MADRGKPWQNPTIESTIGRIKDEYILDEEFLDFQQAYEYLHHVLDWVYNHETSSLGYLTPVEFEAQYQAQIEITKSPDKEL